MSIRKYYNFKKCSGDGTIIVRKRKLRIHDIVSSLDGKNWQNNGKEKILALIISNLIDCDNGNKIETFDLEFRILLIDDCTFNMYVNVLINCKIAMKQRKHTLSKKILFTQISHKIHVVLIKAYFDEQEIIILRCINSLVRLSEYMVKSQSIETITVQANKESLQKEHKYNIDKEIQSLFLQFVFSCFLDHNIFVVKTILNDSLL